MKLNKITLRQQQEVFNNSFYFIKNLRYTKK
jgi:hypothetical protein